MPSNAELITEAKGLADELKIDVQTDGLNNEKLAALVSDLKAKKKDAENVTQADDEELKRSEARKVREAEEAEKAPKKPPYYMAEGRSITSKRGVLGPDDEVKASFFVGGQKTLDKFVKSGHIVKS